MISGPEPERSPKAEQIYQEYLQRVSHVGFDDIESVCLRFPELAEELREMHAQASTAFRPGCEFAARPGEQPASVPVAETAGPNRERYPVLGPLGRGGMGVVERVWDGQLHRELALKRIRERKGVPGPAETPPRIDPRRLARFVREAELTARLDHPGVVPIHEIGVDSAGRNYFTMRLIEGTRLDQVFDLFWHGDSFWTRSRVLDVIVKICETLAFAHSRGIIHRDLKPENIMVGRFGETYVMDWGLAKRLQEPDPPAEDLSGESLTESENSDSVESSTLIRSSAGQAPDSALETQPGAVMGTAAFMSPEQAAGRIAEVDERTDIYALGAILYQLLTGQRPYAAKGYRSAAEIITAVTTGPPEQVARLNPHAQPELVSICEKAMAREKTGRYGSMQLMADDLRAYLENRVVKAHRTGAFAELCKWISRNSGVAAAGALSILATVTGLLAVVILQSVANHEIQRAVALKDAALRSEQEALRNEHAARKLAETERLRTEANSLARESTGVLSTNPGQALLLALESQQRRQTLAGATAAWSALHQLSEQKVLRLHQGGIRQVAVSPDGSRFATGGDDATVIVWNSATLDPMFLIDSGAAPIQQLQYSHNGSWLAVGSRDGTVKIYSAETGQAIADVRKPGGYLLGMRFSPDDAVLAVNAGESAIELLPADETGEPDVLDAPTEIVSFVFTADGAGIVTGHVDGTLRFWNRQTRTSSEPVSVSLGDDCVVRISDDGRWLLALTSVPDPGIPAESAPPPARVTLWNVETRSLATDLDLDQAVYCGAFCPAGKDVLLGLADGTVATISLESLEVTGRQRLADGPVRQLYLSDDQRWLVAISEESPIDIVDRPQGDVRRLRGHDRAPYSVEFLDSRRLVTASLDQTARVWLLEPPGTAELPTRRGPPQGRPVVSAVGSRALVFAGAESVLCSHPDGNQIAVIRGLANTFDQQFTPDGKLVIQLGPSAVGSWRAADGSSCHSLPLAGQAVHMRLLNTTQAVINLQHASGGEVLIWNAQTGVIDGILSLPGQDRILLSPDGRTTWSWSSQNEELHAWETTTGRRIGGIAIPADKDIGYPLMDLSPDGRGVVSARSGTAILFHLDVATSPFELRDSVRQSRNVAISPSGRFVYTGGPDSSCHRFELLTGELLGAYTGFESSTDRIIPSPDDRRLVLTSFDQELRLWDAPSRRSIVRLAEAGTRLPSITFSPDSRYLATVSEAGDEVTLWDPEPGERVARLMVNEPRVRSLEFSADSSWLTLEHVDGSVRFFPVVGTAAVAQRMPATELTPDELDSFEIGTLQDRQSNRRRWEREQLLAWLKLVADSPQTPGEPARLETSAVWTRVMRYVHVLLQSAPPDAVIEDLKSLETGLGGRASVPRAILAAFASGYRQCGAISAARERIEEVLGSPEPCDPRLLAAWAALGFGPLHQSPEQLLAHWPVRKDAAAGDLLWLIETLAAGKVARINSGGDDLVTDDGDQWRHDCFFQGGNRFGETVGLHMIASLEVKGTNCPRLYQTERWFDHGLPAVERGYLFPVPAGRYRVVIHFAEIWFRPPHESRAVEVFAEGESTGCRFDSGETGFATAARREFEISVADGELSLEFRSIRNNPKVSGIEIQKLSR